MGKNEVADKLDEAASPFSPESTASTGSTETKRARDANIRTYYSSPEIRSRLDRVRSEWGLENESHLVRWLLAYALDAVEKGKLKPKWETVKRARLD